MKTSAPKLALMLIRLISTALIGRKTDPKVRNRTSAVTSITIAIAHGIDALKLAMKSADRDGRPPVSTCAPSGDGTARMSPTRARPSFESGSWVAKTRTLAVSWAIQSAVYVSSAARTCSGRWSGGIASSAR